MINSSRNPWTLISKSPICLLKKPTKKAYGEDHSIHTTLHKRRPHHERRTCRCVERLRSRNNLKKAEEKALCFHCRTSLQDPVFLFSRQTNLHRIHDKNPLACYYWRKSRRKDVHVRVQERLPSQNMQTKSAEVDGAAWNTSLQYKRINLALASSSIPPSSIGRIAVLRS
jgi:hypothetical protein